MLLKRDKRGQVAIFVILAIVIVVGVVVYFLIRGSFGVDSIHPELKEVFDYYSECISQETEIALSIAGTQGGRIETEAYIPGSDYAPFSNQLNFLGFSVPYWFYLSGNGLIKENVPTKAIIEDEIEDYLDQSLSSCDLDQFYERGFIVQLDEINTDVKVNELNVEVEVVSDLIVSKGEITSRKRSHEVQVESKIGKFYSIARELYNKQKTEAFLENYSVDVLRLYAPVDGVEIQCSPKIWRTGEVVDDLKEGLEANLGSLKFDGDYYSLSEERNKYFEVDFQTDEQINVIYNKEWPGRFEVYGEGVDNELMVATGIGNQEGLGILGFCYVPYHFVYDMSFPVMIQISDGFELFQFPVVVIVDKNLERQGIYSDIDSPEDFDLCQYNTQDLRVGLYNANLNRVEGNLSFVCFDQSCRLGETKNGEFNGKAPACVNGYVLVDSNGYKEKKELISTNSESSLDIILEREYDVEISVRSGGSVLNSNVIVVFTDQDGKSQSVILPDLRNVKLSEGSYNVKAYVYSNSSINLPGSTRTRCTDVPRSGLLGIFGSTKQECVDIEIPGFKIDYALNGGGQSEEFFLESELEKGKASIYVNVLPSPRSIEDLQNNFLLLEEQGLEVGFE